MAKKELKASASTGGRRNGAHRAKPRAKHGSTKTYDRPSGSRPLSDAHRPLATTVLGQFRLIFRSARKHFQRVQERTGVSGAQLWVLAELHRKPGIRVSELAQAMAVHQSTASNLIERLERNGLLRRERSGEDRRVVRLSLTKSGYQTVARAPRPLQGVLPDALHSLDQRDLAGLSKHLDTLTSRMKVRDSAGRYLPLAEM
jgi:DNA-binding MarR family transcriptional regulator